MTIEIEALYLLIGATSLLAAAVTITIVRFQQKVMNSAAFWSSPTGAAVQAASRDDPLRADLDRQLTELREMVGALAMQERSADVPVASEARFGNAVLLAKQGASLRDLTQCCGLNAGEAQLLLRLHGPRKTLSSVA